MPIEDALQLLSRNFQEVQRGGPSGREAVYALLGQLADGRTLTVMQYDKVIEYLQVLIPTFINPPSPLTFFFAVGLRLINQWRVRF